MNGKYLKEISYCDVLLTDMKQSEIIEDQIKIFYNVRPNNTGFVFYIVKFVSVICDDKNTSTNVFYNPDVVVECLYYGIVYYDGLRHLYMGHEETNNEGYLYYSEPKENILCFKKLDELIQKHCDI